MTARRCPSGCIEDSQVQGGSWVRPSKLQAESGPKVSRLKEQKDVQSVLQLRGRRYLKFVRRVRRILPEARSSNS